MLRLHFGARCPSGRSAGLRWGLRECQSVPGTWASFGNLEVDLRCVRACSVQCATTIDRLTRPIVLIDQHSKQSVRVSQINVRSNKGRTVISAAWNVDPRISAPGLSLTCTGHGRQQPRPADQRRSVLRALPGLARAGLQRQDHSHAAEPRR